MKHMCATLLLLCSTPEVDLHTKFINEVKVCAIQYNSILPEQDRIPLLLVIAQAVHESASWCESTEDYIDLLLTSKHYTSFQKELINQWFTDDIDVNKLIDTLDLYAEDVYYKDKIKKLIVSIERKLYE